MSKSIIAHFLACILVIQKDEDLLASTLLKEKDLVPLI